jgi:hypothetical protein
MIAKFDNATVKVWFQNVSTSRNIRNVVEIEHEGNMMIIKTTEENIHLINFSNVNLIEQV